MATQLQPLGDRVIVEPIEQEEVTSSGIVLPETAKEKPMKGTVLAVGQGTLREDGTRVAPDVESGDTVIYAKYAGTEFKLDGDRKVLIMKENDILAKIVE